jgi:hypothetical protein
VSLRPVAAFLVEERSPHRPSSMRDARRSPDDRNRHGHSEGLVEQVLEAEGNRRESEGVFLPQHEKRATDRVQVLAILVLPLLRAS